MNPSHTLHPREVTMVFLRVSLVLFCLSIGWVATAQTTGNISGLDRLYAPTWNLGSAAQTPSVSSFVKVGCQRRLPAFDPVLEYLF